LTELVKYFERIAVAPLRPPTSSPSHRVPSGVELLAWPLFNAQLLRRAAQAVAARPRAAGSAILHVLRSRDPGRTKNLAVIVKALALAQWVMENEFDHIHAYWISAPATVAYIAAMTSGVAWSSTAHRWDIYERNAFDVKERSAAFVRTISTRGTADLETRMPALRDRVVQLRLGTVVPPIPVQQRAHDDVFRIVCPAALVKVKGHEVLLAALARLRDEGVPVQCTIAGKGPLRDELAARARNLGLEDSIEFTGLVPQERLHEWYRAGVFDAVVLASRNDSETAMEGVPSALIEAMAFGVPVIATDSGSISELIDDRTGRLVRAGDPAALSAALAEVYRDPRAAQLRAQLAYERVAEQYDVRTQMRAFAAALAGTGSMV
jgi:glycosyltransferase involved in cell wall biosynthesis